MLYNKVNKKICEGPHGQPTEFSNWRRIADESAAEMSIVGFTSVTQLISFNAVDQVSTETILTGNRQRRDYIGCILHSPSGDYV